MLSFKRLLIGRPLNNWEMEGEKLPKWKALSIFSSDAISSVAYGPEAALLILTASGMAIYGFLSYISIAILVLLAIVTLSYVQVSRLNPGGGGSYAVARNTLGEIPALTASAALFTDYTLTVAVSISSGTDALISAFPILLPHEVFIDLAVLFCVLMIINLRGVRESSNTFVWPTYAFILGLGMMIVAGLYNIVFDHEPFFPVRSMEAKFSWLAFYVALKAFANGCSAMTGVEAISNGVQMFRKPSVSNAIKTTFIMSGTLAALFGGVAVLMMHYHIMPMDDVTACAQLAEKIFGRGFLFYFIQMSTMLVLYLAANTSFNGLPPLLSILAKDGYMPRALGTRGDRLSFSNGIVLLSIIAGLLIAVYGGNVEHLISLYAVGVFLSFTIAQTGMVVHWFRVRQEDKYWWSYTILNGFGALVTALVVLIIMVTKFVAGAWMIIIFIPLMIFAQKKIRSHYNDMAEELKIAVVDKSGRKLRSNRKINNKIIVPVSSINRVVVDSVMYAKSLSEDVVAVNVVVSDEDGQKLRKAWQEWNPGVPLITLYSPYRMVISPFLDYIDELEKEHSGESDYLTVIIPEFEPRHWWHRLLHNQTGWIMHTLLVLRTNVVVITIPYHLSK